MLNPNLQQSVDKELQKAKPEIRDFVTSKYWQDTIDLVVRVNHIQDSAVIEGIELETILIILNISDYYDIYEALKKEVFADDNMTEAAIRQIAKDIKEYLLDKINQDTNVDSIYLKTEDIRDVMQKEIEHREILPENYIDNRSSVIQKKDNKISAPNIMDIYREKVVDEDMIIGRYPIGAIKPKERVKNIVM